MLDLPSEWGYSFSENCRLKSREEFDLVLKVRAISNQWFVLHARRNDRFRSRLGIIVSKKVIRHASTRNFTKRLIREVFRTSISEIPTLDIVIRARRPLNRLSSKDGRAALIHLLSEAQLKCAIS